VGRSVTQSKERQAMGTPLDKMENGWHHANEMPGAGWGTGWYLVVQGKVVQHCTDYEHEEMMAEWAHHAVTGA